jgi:hypothetical protein
MPITLTKKEDDEEEEKFPSYFVSPFLSSPHLLLANNTHTSK